MTAAATTHLMETAPDGKELVHPRSRQELRDWLAKHHGRRAGLWLANFRPGTGRGLPYEEIVEELLCVGWVDSRVKTLDEERALQWIAPRKPASGWSRSNKERVERLERAGLMTDAGRAAVDVAKRNGSWTLLDGPEALEVPADLAAALQAAGDARRNFDAFPPSARKQILAWIATAKRDETRARRVAETARLAARNVRASR